MNITIIGAGPIGCYVGYLLAKVGHQVSIYEKKKEIGTPIQCTGILTSDFDQFNLPMNEFLVNTTQKIEAYSPRGRKVEIKQKDYIICRKRFDNFMASLAVNKGAKIFLKHSFLKREGNNVVVKDIVRNKEKLITSDIVIAADGPLSKTAWAYGIYHSKRKNYYGIQATVEGEFDISTTKTYFGKSRCPGFFVWVVPESATRARVGLYTTKNSRFYFNKFILENGFKVIGIQAGTIPIFHPQQKLKKDNCYLLGDASGYVKATTGGGIVPGMKQAEILANYINNINCNCRKSCLQKEIKALRKRMQLHLFISKIMNNFSDRDWNRLFNYINQPKIKKIFEKHTRDNPIPLVTKTLLREPRFLYFIKYIF